MIPEPCIFEDYKGTRLCVVHQRVMMRDVEECQRYVQLVEEHFAQVGGVGSELAELIGAVGDWLPMFNVRACDQCRKLKREMNENGPEWCRKNIDMIAGRLKENARANGVRLPTPLYKWAVADAIRRHRRKLQTNGA